MVDTAHTTVAAIAAKAIKKYVKEAERREKGVIKDTDPENLHKMRVGLRRLRTVLQTFAPSIELPNAGREARVAKAMHTLGNLRDIDVITDTLEQRYLPDLPKPERDALKTVFGDFAKQRQKAYKRVKALIRSDRYRAIKTSLRQWSAEPECPPTGMLDVYTTLPDLMLPLISKLWLHPGWLIGVRGTETPLKPQKRLSADAIDQMVTDHSDALHGLRKQVKRVRYQLKLVSPYYGDRLEPDLDRLTELQETLGALQDSLVMEARLATSLPDWQKSLPTLKSLLGNNRHRIWKQWQPLQEYYLNPKHRDELRQTLIHPEVSENLQSKARTPKSSQSKSASSSPASAHSSASSQTSTSAKDTQTPRTSSSKSANSASSPSHETEQ